MIILLSSSKTMRSADETILYQPSKPLLSSQAFELAQKLKNVSTLDIEKIMNVSPALAAKTKELIEQWTNKPEVQLPAADSFLGDVYSGLRYRELSDFAKKRADERLRILSGLYGILRPLDGVYPYRLEMGYKLPMLAKGGLYEHWGDAIARQLTDNLVVNIAPIEYSKAVLPHLNKTVEVVSPRFLTYSQKVKKPTSVAVHAKIARGAFARWLLENDVQNTSKFNRFDLIGYQYSPDLSKPAQPTFVCREFKGIGLSIK